MSLDDEFFPSLRILAAQLGVPPQWFLNLIYLESRFQTTAHRPGSQYYGLTQLNAADIVKEGVDPNGFLTWSASDQLRIIGPWYIATARAYLPQGGTISSPGVLYALNLAPGSVKNNGTSQNAVMYAAPSPYYYANAGGYNHANGWGLDFNRDGTITIGDLDLFMSKLTRESAYLKNLARLDLGTVPTGTANKTLLLAGLGLVVGVGGALFATRRKRR